MEQFTNKKNAMDSSTYPCTDPLTRFSLLDMSPTSFVWFSQAADVYAELRKKVLVKQERQSLESQLCSLIRIEGDGMSCKVMCLFC